MEPDKVWGFESKEPAGSGFDRDSHTARRAEDTRRVEGEIATKRRELAHRSAAYSLPDDVCYHILELAYRHRFPECHTVQYAVKGFPLPIAHVSQRFRALIFSLPAVWSCIHVTPRSGCQDTFSPLLEAQITYSGNYPLTILMSCHTNITESRPHWTNWERFRCSKDFNHYYDCWELLLEHANRWRRLAFYSRLHGFAAEFLTRRAFNRGTSFPSLELLDVYIHDDEDVVVDDKEHLRLSLDQINAPSLQYLRGHNSLVVASKAPTHLRELVIQNMMICMLYPPFIDVLNANSATLETLIVYAVQLDEHNSPSSRLQTLPRLRHLFLGAIDIQTAFATLLHTVLEASPQLLRLDVAHPRGSIDPVFALLGQRSYPSVEILGLTSTEGSVLSGCAFQHCSFEPFLNLRCLLVVGCDCSRYLQTLLERSLRAAQSGTGPLWPRLRSMTLGRGFRWESQRSDAQSVLGRFVDHRAQIGHPLRDLKLDMRVFTDDILREPRQHLNVKDNREERATLKEYISVRRWRTDCGDEPVIPLWSTASLLDTEAR